MPLAKNKQSPHKVTADAKTTSLVCCRAHDDHGRLKPPLPGHHPTPLPGSGRVTKNILPTSIERASESKIIGSSVLPPPVSLSTQSPWVAVCGLNTLKILLECGHCERRRHEDGGGQGGRFTKILIFVLTKASRLITTKLAIHCTVQYNHYITLEHSKIHQVPVLTHVPCRRTHAQCLHNCTHTTRDESREKQPKKHSPTPSNLFSEEASSAASWALVSFVWLHFQLPPTNGVRAADIFRYKAFAFCVFQQSVGWLKNPFCS